MRGEGVLPLHLAKTVRCGPLGLAAEIFGLRTRSILVTGPYDLPTSGRADGTE
jgi:hypothetical protein